MPVPPSLPSFQCPPRPRHTPSDRQLPQTLAHRLAASLSSEGPAGPKWRVMPWTTRLVGRAAEMFELNRARRQAAAGQFRCVLILADAGIGKTRLAREVLARIRGETITLSARAYSLGETASFGVWSEALER